MPSTQESEAREWLRRAGELLRRHLATGDGDALERAAVLYRTALAAAPVGGTAHGVARGNLMAALVLRFPRSGDRAELEELLALAGAAAAARDPSAQEVRILGMAHGFRHRLDGRPADLDAAIGAFRRSAGLPRADAPDRAAALGALGSALELRHRATGGAADLREAEAAFRGALRLLPPGSADAVAATGNLATARFRAFLAGEDAAALPEAIGLLRGCLPAAPPGSAERRAVLGNLAVCLREAVAFGGDRALHGELLRVSREALAAVPEDDPDHADRLAGLGIALRLAAEGTGDTATLCESVEVLRRAVRLTGPAAPALHDRVNALGNALHRLAEATGDPLVLDEAVGVLRRAVAGWRPGEPGRVSGLGNLAVALWRRYEQTGDLDALREAAACARRAVAGGGGGPGNRTAQLSNLAVVLQSWHEATGERAAAAEAVDIARAALALVPAGGALRTDRLNVLANALRCDFDAGGGPELLREAVALLEEAAGGTAYDDPALATVLSNLGSAWLTVHHRLGDPGALDQAVGALGRAVWATDGRAAEHGVHLITYGDALGDVYGLEGDPGVLEAAGEAYREAAGLTALPAHRRVAAAWRWGAAAAAGGRWAEALEGHELAVELLPLAASGRLSRRDQEQGLAHAHGLAAEAAACALNAGRPDRAIVLLEAGRGVLMGRTMGVREEFVRLRREHPGTARECEELWERIEAQVSPPRVPTAAGAGGGSGLPGADSGFNSGSGGARSGLPGSDSGSGSNSNSNSGFNSGSGGARSGPARSPRSDVRHELAAQWERLVIRIRTLPGFGGFLAAPSAQRLLDCAREGPVVLAYCCDYRSDALVLHGGRIDPVPLPGATPQAVRRQVERLDEALVAAVDPLRERQGQQALSEVLAWTWNEVAGPVLDRLWPAGGARGEDRPRLWWSPGGLLAGLPLHAAGHHEAAPPAPDHHAAAPPAPDLREPAPPPRTVLDRVVSSYTPTVRALAYARRRAAGPEPGGALLAVALPRTPGAAPLGGVRREVRVLEGLLGAPRVLEGELATFARVLEALPAHPYAHFACHAVGDPGDPSNARLLVHDHRVSPLTVREVSRLDLAGARLAVLSACGTARGDLRLADEAVHITSAFQIAGYPHAVGTLWPVHDAVAVRMTRSLYGALREGLPAGSGELDTRRAAAALHRAVRECRAAFPGSPSLWAAHVHAGA